MCSKSVCLCYCKWAVGLDLITARLKHVCLSNFCEPSSPETGDFENSEAEAVNQLKQPSSGNNLLLLELAIV